MKNASAVRRLAVAAGLLIAVLVACGREITGPVATSVNALRRMAAVAFEPKYETAIPASVLPAALQQVAFERVHITLRREDGSIALDTTVLFPAGSDELTLTLNVPLPANTSSAGIPLSLNLGYVNAAGDTVFKGGPIPLTVVPTTAGGTPTVPVQVPVHYTGTGASATFVVISPKVVNGLAGQTTTFTAQALGSGGQVIPGTPVVYTSSNPAVVNVNETTGLATLVGRGTAKVYALLLTGPADSAVVTVTLPATQLVLGSGNNQTASAGSTLPAAVVARVLASDDVGVGGTTVTISASGGGTVTPASAVSDASGNVSTQWKLGPTAGAQTMTITAAGLTGSPLTVNATAQAVVATKLAVQTGPASAKAGATLPAITVAAQDAGGTTVTSFTGDVNVAIGTNPGSATLSGTTTVKAVNGIATFSDLKLNRPGTGYTLAFSSTSLSPAVSGTFNITVGDAAKLSFGPMPSAVDAGVAIAPPVTVTAQDAEGNAVTSFTGAVTIAFGTSPTGASLSGTLARNAIAGVATFGDLTIRKSGTPYTLTAAATALTGVTSAPFNVAPGAPTGVSLVSGGGQSAASGTSLSPIVVRLHDAFNNGIGGASITFAVTGGGGTLSSASATTDADGNANVVWTIGAGPQTMTATFASLPPLTITATSTSATITWTGTTSSAWATASNWSPAAVPTAVDAVVIATATNAPIISASTSVGSVSVATGATLTNNAVLTVNGSVDAGTTIAGSGTVVLAGASGSLKGVINQPVIVSGAAYTLNGTTVTGPLEVNATGKLTVGGQSLTVNGSLVTSASGRLAMNNSADVVTVTGNTFFQGGSENGFLTAGALVAQGNFTTSGASFGATGSHTLRLSGAASPQTLTFTSPAGGQGINHLIFENAAAKTMAGTVQIMGDVSLDATSGPVDGAVSASIGGNFTDNTIFPDSGGNPNPLGGWRVANTEFFGSNKTINSKFITSSLTVSGTVQFAGCSMCGGDRLVNVLSSSYGYVQINGNLTVSGTGAVLKLNGNSVDVYGDFATASGGVVDLTSYDDYLYVDGSAVFGGGSEAGKLTLGSLEVVQDFTQTGAADSFAPSADFYTTVGEYYAFAGLRSSRARSARAVDTRSQLSPAQEGARGKRTKQFAALRAQHDRRSIRLQRRAAAYAARGLAAPSTDPTAVQNSSAERAVWRRTPRRSYSGTSNITFANPGSSYFGTLYLAGPEYLLGSNMNVTGRLETGMSYWHEVYSSSTTPRAVSSNGADVRNLGFDNVSWTLTGTGDIWSLDYVEFDDMDPTVNQFTMSRTGDEGPNCECATGEYELYEWYFYTTPTTGHFINAEDTNGGPNILTLYMDYPTPTVHGGHLATSGGAVILNWPETAVVTWAPPNSEASSWNDAANWSTGVLPTSSDDVLIPSGALSTPRLNTDNGYAHHLTIESGMNIRTSCSYELYVHGNVVAPLDAAGVQTCEGDGIHLMGDGTSGGNTVEGRFEVVKVEAAYKLPGMDSELTVDYDLTIDGTGNLTVNGGQVHTQSLSTISDATFTMTNSADYVDVRGGASFNGASSTLTAGTLTITDGSLSAGANYFAPTGTHTVIFAGTTAYVSFTNPAQSFLRNVQIEGGATMFLNSDALVTGTLARGTGSGITRVATTSYPSPAHMLTVSGLNQSGADAMQFDNVTLTLTDGAAVTFNNVQFAGYGPGFFGESLFEINRSSGPIYFTGLDFSTTGFAADTTRHFVKNSGSANINLISPTPGTGTNGTHFIATGGGTVTWPYLP